MADLSTVLISSGVGAGVSAIGAFVNNFVSVRTKIDEQLRTDRTRVYTTLWQKTILLPPWPRNPNATYEDLASLSESFKDWYFCEGGIFLSKHARDEYFQAQKALQAVAEWNARAVPSGGRLRSRDVRSARRRLISVMRGSPVPAGRDPIGHEVYEFVRAKLSLLRTAITGDLQSRDRASRLFG